MEMTAFWEIMFQQGRDCMFGVLKGELLLYGGLGAMTMAVLGAVLCTVIFILAGRRLKKKLEKEYGRPHIFTGNEGSGKCLGS